MAVIKKDGNFMGLPMNIARGNPIPLDKSEIWYSYEELVNYAKNDPVAYVGQILGYVNEEAGTAKAYIILNAAGDLEEIGASVEVPQLKGDNASISVFADTEIISLKNWGVQYYKFIAASGSKENNDYVAPHFELQVVDNEHPWKEGLEPRVVKENGSMVLGWYEPDPTIVDNINNQLSDLREQVTNVYTKSETDSLIASAVADAGHLSRKIVKSVAEIDVIADDADKYIYMVPNGLSENDDKYDEYIVVDNRLEKVGSWEVDLDNYVTEVELYDALKNKVDKKEGFSLISDKNVAKLEEIEEGAQKNYIDNVDAHNFEVDSKNTLKLVSVAVAQVANLQELLNAKVDAEDGKGLSTNDLTNELLTTITNNNASVQVLVQSVANLEQLLKTSTDENGNYVSETLEIIQNRVGSLSDLISQNTADIALQAQTIANLNSLLNTTASQVTTNTNEIAVIKRNIGSLEDLMGNFVSIDEFESVVGTFEEMKNETATIYAQVKELQEALTWGNIEEI